MNRSDNFCESLVQRCGEEFQRCLQCLSCASGCPSSQAMAYRPNGVIRLVQYGHVQEVLESPDIWLCVGCTTCAIDCPMAIDIPALMESLRQIAIETGAKINESGVLNFHQKVLSTILRHGRPHKLEKMPRRTPHQKDFFK